MATAIFLKPIKSRKQLRNIQFQNVLHAGFTDDSEEFFEITFDLRNGNKQDLVISFETRTARAYLSNIYKE